MPKIVPNTDSIFYVAHARQGCSVTIFPALIGKGNKPRCVPVQYIGEQIKVRYDPSCMDKAYIFDDNGKCCAIICPVNKIDTAKTIRASTKKSVDFSSFSIQEVCD